MAMALLLVVAAALLFAGATFLAGFLAARPLWFLIWWGVCAWLTFCAVLLAVYDLLTLARAARRLRRELRHRVSDPTRKEPRR